MAKHGAFDQNRGAFDAKQDHSDVGKGISEGGNKTKTWPKSKGIGDFGGLSDGLELDQTKKEENVKLPG